MFQETATISEPAALSESDFRYVQMSVPGGVPSIYRAVETSSKIWVAAPEEAIVEFPTGASAPFVWREGGGVAVYFASSDGASIQRAWSPDGASFGAAETALVAETAGWEKGWVGSPSVIEFAGEQLLFYEGGPGGGIGIARLDAAGTGAERLQEHAAIDPSRVEDPLFWRSVQSVSTPHAVVVGDAVRIYFTAFGAEGNAAVQGDEFLPAAINDSIGLVTTRDLIHFEPFPTGPIYARRASIRAYLGEREPHLFFSDEGVRLYFRATAGKVNSGLAVAVSE